MAKQKKQKPTRIEDRHIFLAALVVVMSMALVYAYMSGVSDTLNALPADTLL